MRTNSFRSSPVIRRTVWTALFVCFSIWMMQCRSESPEAGPPAWTQEEAKRIAQSVLIVDTHIDVPMHQLGQWKDISARVRDRDFDLVRAREGGLDVVFMAIYIPARLGESRKGRKRADAMIDLVEQMAADWPGQCELVRSVGEVREAAGRGKVLLAMGMENGAPMNGDLASLRHFYRRGVRYVTLTHMKANHICDSSGDPARPWNGLSPFGRSLVEEMNRLGVMIDVSHLSDSAFYQVVRLSRAPVLASHSSCRSFTPGWERNMSDEMIRALALNGGVIQLNFGSEFLTAVAQRYPDSVKRHVREVALVQGWRPGEKESEDYERQYRTEHPFPYAALADFVDHVDHVVELVGIDHVGLGSDFEGVSDTLPVGLKDVSQYPNLVLELLKRGYSEEEIAKICSGNLMRVWSAVEACSGQEVNR
ncbi:MAG: dipeptidase [Bacteroidota bacterium]